MKAMKFGDMVIYQAFGDSKPRKGNFVKEVNDGGVQSYQFVYNGKYSFIPVDEFKSFGLDFGACPYQYVVYEKLGDEDECDWFPVHYFLSRREAYLFAENHHRKCKVVVERF